MTVPPRPEGGDLLVIVTYDDDTTAAVWSAAGDPPLATDYWLRVGRRFFPVRRLRHWELVPAGEVDPG